jgi:molecular chaperone GrpE
MSKLFKKLFSMQEKETTTPDEPALDQAVAEETTISEPSDAAEPTLNPEVELLQQQLEEARKQLHYLMADFENLRRNTARERLEMRQTAGRDIIAALLPVVDDFERAQKNNALNEGMNLIYHKLVNTLKTHGLSPVPANVGDTFNPDLHEAVTEIPVPDEALKGKIVDTLEQGYSLGERMIRFAKVVVGR